MNDQGDEWRHQVTDEETSRRAATYPGAETILDVEAGSMHWDILKPESPTGTTELISQ